MSIDTQKLNAALADPAVIALSDDDAAKLLSTPTLTAKKSTVTITTLAAVWGDVAAATFLATLRGAIAAGQAQGASPQSQQLGAASDLALTVLGGPGLDPANASAQSAAAMFVEVGIAKQEQVNGVFFDTIYRAGDVVSAQDVTTARAETARAAAYDSAYRLASDQYNAAIGWLDAQKADGKSAPSDADVLATMGAKQ
jgi:hypothetical protein